MNDADIQVLEALADRMAGFEEGLSLEWLDGYLTAIAASRRRIAPEEWLPAMADGVFERTFADPQDAAAARAPIERRWRELLAELDPEALLEEPDALHLSPLMREVSAEDLAQLREQGVSEEDLAALGRTGEAWAVGFLEALSDFAADWPEPDDEDAAQMLDACLEPVAALMLDEAGLAEQIERHYEGKTLTRDDWIDEAIMGVQDARLFWLDHMPKGETRHVEKVGRNDPCPCGSGKKWKKCHGAEAGDV